MRRIAVIALSFVILAIPINASAASKATAVTAAFKTVLSSAGNSLDALEQSYEADVDALDAALAQANTAANAVYALELAANTSQFSPLILAANKTADSSKLLFNANNMVKIGTGGGFFGGTNLANYLDCPLPAIKPGGLPFEIAKRFCANTFGYAVAGSPSPTRSGATIGSEDWQPGDLTTIQISNSGENIVQNGIAAGYIIPVNLSLFDSSRLSYKQALDDAASLTLRSENARNAAGAKLARSLAASSATRQSELDALTAKYELAKAQAEAQEAAANLALLAAKRASKDSVNFDKAFSVAYKFEYNRKKLNEIADLSWDGNWTYRTIDTIIKVNKLAKAGDSIAGNYSLKNGSAFNTAVGNAFTNEPDFRAALKVVTSVFKKTTGATLSI